MALPDHFRFELCGGCCCPQVTGEKKSFCFPLNGLKSCMIENLLLFKIFQRNSVVGGNFEDVCPEKVIRFKPPLYKQRYQFVKDLVDRHEPKKVIIFYFFKLLRLPYLKWPIKYTSKARPLSPTPRQDEGLQTGALASSASTQLLSNILC